MNITNELLREDLETDFSEIPDKVSIFSVSSANEIIDRERIKPEPKILYSIDDYILWVEGQCICLFSQTGVGKSLFAVQVGAHIAKKYQERVVLMDFELSDYQFMKRYKNHRFPDSLLRLSVNPEYFGDSDSIVESVGQTMRQLDAKILVLDNLTCCVQDDTKGDLASRLMKQLIRYKRELGLSILVISHTPKLPPFIPVSLNHLSGSSKLSIFFDGVHALAPSAQSINLRYLKMLKSRDTEKVDQVLVLEKKVVDGALMFETRGVADEKEHLNSLVEVQTMAVKLRQEGKSLRNIEQLTGLPKSSVQRLLKYDE